MFCTACGRKADEKSVFCINCGARLPQRPAPTAPPMAVPPSAVPRPTVKKSANTPLVIVLVVVGGLMLLGIVSAIAIPNLLTASQKAKVKSTRHDISLITTALMDYLTDNGSLPLHLGGYGGGYANSPEFVSKLSPFYIKVLPIKDAWGNDFHVYCGEACNGRYGLRGCTAYDVLVVSLGKDGVPESWEYNSAAPGVGIQPIAGIRDFDRDLIMLNGTWIRAPLP